jgi:glycosyltransferase involved in cell wall biosynthesis
VGTRAREYLAAHGIAPTRIFASPHAVDNDLFAATAAPHLTPAGRLAARRALGLPAADFVVLFVGRLNGRKRVEDALAAVARLGRGATLLVIGDGDWRTRSRPWRGSAAARRCW